MKTIQKIIQAGFATCALASASLPALSWTVWPDVDFEWYARAGQPPTGAVVTDFPREKREGYIWAPSHYERTTDGRGQKLVKGHWIKDDYYEQVAIYSAGAVTVATAEPAKVYSSDGRTVIATGPTTLRDSQGNVIPTNPESYPIDSVRR